MTQPAKNWVGEPSMMTNHRCCELLVSVNTGRGVKCERFLSAVQWKMEVYRDWLTVGVSPLRSQRGLLHTVGAHGLLFSALKGATWLKTGESGVFLVLLVRTGSSDCKLPNSLSVFVSSRSLGGLKCCLECLNAQLQSFRNLSLTLQSITLRSLWLLDVDRNTSLLAL